MYLDLIRRILGYGCFILAWILPDRIPPWRTFPNEVLVAVALLLWTPWLKTASWPYRIVAITLCASAMIILQAASGAIPFGDLVLGLILAYFICLAASLGARQSLDEPRAGGDLVSIDGICASLVIAALINAMVGFFQWQGAAENFYMVPSAGRVYGNLAQPNHFATLMVMAIAGTFHLNSKKRINDGWALTISLLLAIGLAASESRTGALSFSVLVFIAVIVGRDGKFTRQASWLALLFGVYWLLYLNWPAVSAIFHGKANRNPLNLDSSTRFELWHQSIEALLLSPWRGYGWLQFGSAQNAVASQIGGVGNMDHAHNIYLDLLIWFGVPGGLLLGGAFTLWLIVIIRQIFRRNISERVLSCILIMEGVVIHGMLEYPYAYTYFALTFAFFAGVVEGELKKSCLIQGRALLSVRLISLGVFVLSCKILLEYPRIDGDYRALRFEREFVTDPAAAHVYSDKPLLLTQYGDLVSMMRIPLGSRVDRGAIEQAKRVAMRFPWFAVHKNYYLILLSNGYCEEASYQKGILRSLYGDNAISMVRESVQKMRFSMEESRSKAHSVDSVQICAE